MSVIPKYIRLSVFMFFPTVPGVYGPWMSGDVQICSPGCHHASTGKGPSVAALESNDRKCKYRHSFIYAANMMKLNSPVNKLKAIKFPIINLLAVVVLRSFRKLSIFRVLSMQKFPICCAK